MDFVDVRKVPEFIEDNTNSTEEPAWKHRTYKLYIQKFTYLTFQPQALTLWLVQPHVYTELSICCPSLFTLQHGPTKSQKMQNNDLQVSFFPTLLCTVEKRSEVGGLPCPLRLRARRAAEFPLNVAIPTQLLLCWPWVRPHIHIYTHMYIYVCMYIYNNCIYIYITSVYIHIYLITNVCHFRITYIDTHVHAEVKNQTER